jgi:hypothetical protein
VDYNKIFPDEKKPDATPVDFVPKASSVVCGIQCTGIWIGGKGWGVTWKLVQAIVKPKVVVSVYDRCHIRLSVQDKDAIQKEPLKIQVPEVDDEPMPEDTIVEDSDNEDEPVEEPVMEEPVPVVEPVKKKIVKKAEPEPETPAPVKKVLKKKVVSV